MNWFVPILILMMAGIAQLLTGQEPAAEAPAGPTPSLPGSSSDAAGLLKNEFVFEQAPFAKCHASTIALTEQGPVAAWFGGTRESHPDVGIWVSRRLDAGWTPPVEVANGIQFRSGGKKHSLACWNPVLFQPKDGDLYLFYKCGAAPSEWWGMQMSSADSGETWTVPRRLPEGILGPIKNKPLELEDGSWLCGSSTEHSRLGWNVHFERTADRGRSWERIGPVKRERRMSCIQPTLLRHGGDLLQMLCRTRVDVIAESWSKDGGKTWSELAETLLPNPNAGIDGVSLQDGRQLLVYNHGHRERYGRGANGRDKLNVAVSQDGKAWLAALQLEFEPGEEFSYPSVVQAADGKVHLTYTHKRTRIRYVVIDPAQLKLRGMADGAWPKSR